ncbi:unnamed protein product [Linum trigynum]|uniref:COP1-interacting protein 7 n=1 Tax=Linum trigynum TaxID=586398 RepID=A0AAV2GJU9_9ROSI
MRSSTRLDSAVFQLTPTRTRCDLVINANGKTEKIATGLVNPFLAHLKAAQDQMAKGGYSINLVPDNGSDAPWFTKETIERFVRFVSTPEILERVYTLESEILQMDEAITVQSSGDFGRGTVEDHHMKFLERSEGVHIGRSCVTLTGSKSLPDSSEEKAIVLYQPGTPPEANEPPEDSKLQLKKVLEARKTVLQKEQGMAFARAVAAGFTVDQIAPLMSFAESFGASRMRDACVKFKELWTRKHETGQWVEIEAAEAMSGRPEFSLVNSSGIVLANGANGIGGAEHGSDENATMDQPLPQQGQQGYFQGQIPHPMFSPWPVNSPPGTLPVVQGIPMQGIPYYQNYPGNSPFVQQPYASGEDNRINNGGQRVRRRRHSMDCGDSGYSDTATWEEDASRTRSHDDTELDNHNTSGKGGRSSSGRKKKSGGTVVIRNLNYITSNRQEFSDDDASQSASSGPDDEGRGGDSSPNRDYSVVKQKNTNKEADDGQWQAFQTYLLKDADDEAERENGDMFAMEKATRNKGSADESLKRDRRTGQLGNGRRLMDAELDGRRVGYRRTANDDFIVDGQRNHSGYNTEDPLAVDIYENRKKSSQQDMDDGDSYIVPLRSPLQYQGESTKGSNAAIDMDSEFISARPEVSGAIVKYEPDDLTLVHERETERGMLGYDPALDYDMEVHADHGGKKGKKAENDVNPGSRKSDKGPRSKRTPDSSDKKRTVGPIRKGKPSKSSPLEEAKARAEKLRSFKADLQKMKKEREEEEMKRLALLKLERQKRIAAKGGSLPAQSTPLQTRKSLPTKLSPISHKSSKFSDSEPGPSSPLQRSSIKHLSSSDSVKASMSSKLSTTGSQSAGNRASRSVSSLPELKKEDNTVTTDTKASMAARIRRLSEPKVISSHHVAPAKPRKTELAPSSSVKPKSGEPMASKQKLANGPETKKISAIVNHDKGKAASLPELKTRTPKASDVVVQGKAVATETTQDGNGSKSVMTSDGSVVAEGVKKSSFPTSHTSEEDIVRVQISNSEVKTDTVAEGTSQASTQHQTLGQSSADQVMAHNASVVAKESSRVSNSSVDEKPYQAPFARNSSLEDPCTRNSEYGKAPPTVLLQPPTTTTGTETLRARVSDPMNLKLEKIPEVVDKSEVKESPKGFRRLLKFARKSHAATSDRNSEVDNMSIKSFEADDGVANAAATTSNEAHNTLKNLISQDETPTAATTLQKSSRHFSLLSPFRSKTSEKKLPA